MKTRVLTVAAVILAAVALFGRDALKSHFNTLRREAKSAVRQATPADYEVHRIKELITEMTKRVMSFDDKIGEIDANAASQAEEARKLEERINTDRADLLAERNLLSGEGDVFQIRGTAYSRSQVETSAQARMARIRRDEAALATKKLAIERLKGAVVEARNRLREAVAVRDQKVTELEALEAELANAELTRDLQSLVAPLRDDVLVRSQGELAESMKAFSDRVRGVQREVDASMRTDSAPALIEHSPAGTTGIVDEIDRLLVPAPRPTTATLPKTP